MRLSALLSLLGVIGVVALTVTSIAGIIFHTNYLDVKSGTVVENCTTVGHHTKVYSSLFSSSSCDVYASDRCFYGIQTTRLTRSSVSCDEATIGRIESYYPVGSGHLYYRFRRTVVYRREEEYSSFYRKYSRRLAPLFITLASFIIVCLISVVVIAYLHNKWKTEKIEETNLALREIVSTATNLKGNEVSL